MIICISSTWSHSSSGAVLTWLHAWALVLTVERLFRFSWRGVPFWNLTLCSDSSGFSPAALLRLIALLCFYVVGLSTWGLLKNGPRSQNASVYPLSGVETTAVFLSAVILRAWSLRVLGIRTTSPAATCSTSSAEWGETFSTPASALSEATTPVPRCANHFPHTYLAVIMLRCEHNFSVRSRLDVLLFFPFLTKHLFPFQTSSTACQSPKWETTKTSLKLLPSLFETQTPNSPNGCTHSATPSN